MDRAQTIAVIGAGTAGSAATLFLARAGHRVTLFERVAAPGPVGAGIVLQPTGQAVLARLGLLGPVAERGGRIDRLRCLTDAGRTIVDLSYADLVPRGGADLDLHGLGLHRGVLFEALFHAAAAEASRVVLGAAIVRTERRADGRVVVDASGVEHGPFDLVVVADGAGSTLACPSAPRRTVPYAWGALWAVVPDPAPRPPRELYQRVRGARRMFGLLPTGRGPGDDPRPLMSVYWSVRGDRVERVRARGLAAWKDEARRLEPSSAPVLDAIEDVSQLVFGAYRDVSMRRWHGDAIVWLGDAAHAMSPQLGQGANLALWDAMTLADALDGARSIAEGLARYTRLRAPHLGFYQLATRALTPLFQGDSSVLAWLRDLAMPVGLALPPIRRRMVRSMAGLERGLVRPAFPLDAVRAALPAPR